jgi:hypothetical protein
MRRECERAGVGGVAGQHAPLLLSADGGEWKGAGLSSSSRPSELLRQAQGLPDSSNRLSPEWLPPAQVPLGVKIGGECQTRA